MKKVCALIQLVLPGSMYMYVALQLASVYPYIQAIHRHKLSKHWLTRLVDARVSAHITITPCHKCTHLVNVTKGCITSDHSAQILKSGLVYHEQETNMICTSSWFRMTGTKHPLGHLMLRDTASVSTHNQLFIVFPLPQERELGVNAYLSTRDLEEYGERTSSSLLYLTLQALGQYMSMQCISTSCTHN